jgi:hypothetical protein
VLLSESFNHLLSRKGRDLTLTEQMIILSCDRCGRSFTADRALISGQPRCVEYACPHDGAGLASVSDEESFKGAGFSGGSPAFRVGGEELGWEDFWTRHLQGGPPGSGGGLFSGEFYAPGEEPGG